MKEIERERLCVSEREREMRRADEMNSRVNERDRERKFMCKREREMRRADKMNG